MSIAYDARSFIIRGRRELLVGGEFHYFRTPHELWEDRLVKMKRCGCNHVTTYIPWNWHEPEEGKERWTGDQDLARFLDLCTKHGLFVIVKPGPYICAEWDFGGHPDWLLPKHLRLRMLDDKYLACVDNWYRRVAEVIRPFLVTNGGNIIAIQVENEYDHLLWGDEKIPAEDAKEYFRRLEEMLNRHGIDIPKFANDASFLRGSSIIETRTYYPSIPWFWKRELAFYDKMLAESKKAQPDKPLMVLELQSGWFAMFGHPAFVPDPLLIEAVSQSALSLGASYLNLYMFCGGTTFPFWGCRGDIYDVLPVGTGTTTSFDFGGSPVREWGELNPDRYDWMRIFSLFTQDFKDLILLSDSSNGIEVLAGGEDTALIHRGTVELDRALASPSERFRILVRRLDNQHLVMLRNMGERDLRVDVGRACSDHVLFRGLELPAHESCILPVGVNIPGTGIVVERSTSSLLFHHAADGRTVFGLFGKPGRAGETVLNVPPSEVTVLSGEVRISGHASAVLSYVHRGMHVVRVQEHTLVILDQSLAAKVDKLPGGGVMIADTYFVREMEPTGRSLSLRTEMRNSALNRFFFVGTRPVASVLVDGQPFSFRKDDGCSAAFEFRDREEQAVELEWTGDWRMREDTAEAGPAYRDDDWRPMERPASLEDAGLLRHGYVWYRMNTRLPEGASDVSISVPGNGIDYFRVFVNGEVVWAGIAETATQNIQGHVQPGQNVIAVLYENFYHTKSHPHEGVIQKYSGVGGPVVVSGTAGGKPFRRRIRRFKVREGLGGELIGCIEPGFDDSGWVTVPASRKYVMSPALGGVVWMRRGFRFRIRKGWRAAVKLTIPDAKNRLILYLNGRPLGQFEHVGPQHDFYIPEPFLREENVLAIAWGGHQSFGDHAKGFIVEPILGTFLATRDVRVQIELSTGAVTEPAEEGRACAASLA